MKACWQSWHCREQAPHRLFLSLIAAEDSWKPSCISLIHKILHKARMHMEPQVTHVSIGITWYKEISSADLIKNVKQNANWDKTPFWCSCVHIQLSLTHTQTQTVFMPAYCRSGLASAWGEQTDARVTASQLAMGLIDAQQLRESKQTHDNVFIFVPGFHNSFQGHNAAHRDVLFRNTVTLYKPDCFFFKCYF